MTEEQLREAYNRLLSRQAIFAQLLLRARNNGLLDEQTYAVVQQLRSMAFYNEGECVGETDPVGAAAEEA